MALAYWTIIHEESNLVLQHPPPKSLSEVRGMGKDLTIR